MSERMKIVKIALWWFGIVLAIVLPFLLPKDYHVHMLVLAGIYSILALSLGLIMGFTGQVSLCHAAFYGIGAYTSSLLALNWDWPFWISLWVGAIGAGFVSFLLGCLVLRLKGHFLAITTAFFGIFVALLFNNLTELTKGPMGLPGIPRPASIDLGFLKIDFITRTSYYYLVLCFAGFAGYCIYRLIHSRFGQAMIAIRENEELSQSIGVNSMKIKLLSFTVGGMFAGLAGAIYAHYILFISPVSFTLAESINILTMVIFGCMQSFWGPIVGSFLLTILPEFLRMAGELRMTLYGLALMLLIIFLPSGLVCSIKEKWFSPSK